jgi:hypothetical protein
MRFEEDEHAFLIGLCSDLYAGFSIIISVKDIYRRSERGAVKTFRARTAHRGKPRCLLQGYELIDEERERYKSPGPSDSARRALFQVSMEEVPKVNIATQTLNMAQTRRPMITMWTISRCCHQRPAKTADRADTYGREKNCMLTFCGVKNPIIIMAISFRYT